MQPMLMTTKKTATFATYSLLIGLSFGVLGKVAVSQATPPAAAPTAAANRFVGTITQAATGALTVKTDAGMERKVIVPDGIKLQRIAPGEKDLSKAATIPFSELSVGDRVLVRLSPSSTSDPVSAISIIAIPQADLAQKQQKDKEEWQRNGIGGLVKSVDAGTGVILVTSGAGSTQKTITLHTTPATILRRYAANSVNFDEAKPAPIETIQAGDQLRARGVKSADGMELAATEVVSGSFRNISGTVASINASAMTLTLKDLATKQNVTVHVTADVQMRKLPEQMAKTLSSMTKAGDEKADAQGANAGAAPQSTGAPAPASNAAAPGGQGGMHNHDAARGAYGGPGSGEAGGRHAGGDFQTMLSRAPAIHLSDLQKGDAVMLVSTQGSTDVTAITLLAGVESLLQAPASTQNMLLSNWNMSSGAGEGAQ